MTSFSSRYRRSSPDSLVGDEDPLAGMANLFDVSLAFIVALLLAIFSLLSIEGLFDPDRDLTILTRNDAGEMTLVTTHQERIEVQKITDQELSGQGTRLGTAYRLPDGQVVYVPETGD